MRLFEIKDEVLPGKLLGYLIYYEIPKAFYVELSEEADAWETPMYFSAYVEKGQYSINRGWSHRWVQSRIVPRDRQNIFQILRDNGLSKYDECKLLLLAMGRCEQDDCYLVEVPASPLPEFLQERWKTKVDDILPLDLPRLLVFFRDGKTKSVDVGELHGEGNPCLLPFLQSQERFQRVEVQPDGYGVYWNEQAFLSHGELYSHGVEVPLKRADFLHFITERVVSAPQATQILECSRQNLDDLMRRDKLHPIREEERFKLFPKVEVMQRKRTDDS